MALMRHLSSDLVFQALTGLLLVVTASAAPASVWRVNTEGTGDAPTIQAAIEQATAADTVLIEAGTYTEHLVLENKPLTLVGEAGAQSTVLDGGLAGRILTLRTTGERVVLQGLTLRRGRPSGIMAPGGAVAAFRSPLTIDGCVFEENLVNLGVGGAVFSTFLATAGAPSGTVDSPREGIPAGETAYIAPLPPAAEMVIINSRFVGNRAGSDGGAVFSEEVPSSFSACVFRQNTAVQGGAVALLHHTHFVTHCVFDANEAKGSGGGLHFTGNGVVTVNETLFSDNRADDFGGGLRAVSGMELEIVRSWFIGNTAYRGAGAHVLHTPLTAERVFWTEGSAADRGGGILVDDSDPAAFTHCSWLGNTAGNRGASLSSLGSSLSIASCYAGDDDPEALDCPGGDVIHAACNAGGPSSGGCVAFVARMAVEACPSFPDALCTLPTVPGCGVVGHAETICPQGSCATPALPATWGRLKSRYR
jgi:predicted outer membrane repeat protein